MLDCIDRRPAGIERGIGASRESSGRTPDLWRSAVFAGSAKILPRFPAPIPRITGITDNAPLHRTECRMGQPDCPFCRLEKNRIRLESEFAVAFLDGFPVTTGHTLVIPRRHVASLFELTDKGASASTWKSPTVAVSLGRSGFQLRPRSRLRARMELEATTQPQLPVRVVRLLPTPCEG